MDTSEHMCKCTNGELVFQDVHPHCPVVSIAIRTAGTILCDINNVQPVRLPFTTGGTFESDCTHGNAYDTL
jgi:hypothetical protein